MTFWFNLYLNIMQLEETQIRSLADTKIQEVPELRTIERVTNIMDRAIRYILHSTRTCADLTIVTNGLSRRNNAVRSDIDSGIERDKTVQRCVRCEQAVFSDFAIMPCGCVIVKVRTIIQDRCVGNHRKWIYHSTGTDLRRRCN